MPVETMPTSVFIVKYMVLVMYTILCEFRILYRYISKESLTIDIRGTICCHHDTISHLFLRVMHLRF